MPSWKNLIKLGFFAGIGWWLSVAATTMLDYALIMIVQVAVAMTTGQPV